MGSLKNAFIDSLVSLQDARADVKRLEDHAAHTADQADADAELYGGF